MYEMLLLFSHTLCHCGSMHSYTRARRHALASYEFGVVTDGNVIHSAILRHIYMIFVFFISLF
jgi:hypothetical protein